MGGLVSRFTLTARLALLSFLCIAGFGAILAVELRGQVRDRALASAANAGHAVNRLVISPLLEPGDATTPLSPARRAALDRVAVAGGELLGFTLHGPDGRVVYATGGNSAPKARASLVVTPTAQFETREIAAMGRVGVVSITTPVVFGASATVGSAETLVPEREIGDAVAADLRELYLLLAFGLGVLSAILLPPIVGATHRLRQQENGRRHSANHDDLTGLPNRTRFYREVTDALQARREVDAGLAIMLIDLDRFKEINDTLGHHKGDEVLIQVAERLKSALRSTDTIARLGGDEYAVLLRGVGSDEATTRIGDKVRGALDEPFTIEGITIDVEASVGIAVSPEHGQDVHILMQRADIAMYAAKNARAGVLVYDAEQDRNTPDRLAMVGELRRAVDNDELILHYQPKALLGTGVVEGAEALVRWRHPERGLVPPFEFIPIAEETGLMKPITLWVVDAALRQAKAWRDQGLDLTISVNISAQNLHDPNLTDDIAGLLAKWDAGADWLQLEITESAVMLDPQGALDRLVGLADMGLELSMDDYGTGYSALNYLKRLPLSELKIDRSFVSNITVDQKDALIIGSTIELGHNLGLRVVAEGIETEAEWIGLQILGCDVAQGYFLGRPMPADEFVTWLEASGRDVVQPPLRFT